MIALDTETTGLEWKKGNRVVEIGCVELLERRPTGRTYHTYLHPDRDAVIGDTVDGRSHAWIEVWTGDWWSYDPTNDSGINEHYVSVGAGRDYTDVAPLKGIYSGEGATDLDVIVEVTRLA